HAAARAHGTDLRLPPLRGVDAGRPCAAAADRAARRVRAGHARPTVSVQPEAVSRPSEVALRVSCVRHVYPDRTQVHLCGLDFVVQRGERVVILGPNGCGKTTLLSHILGLLEPQEGDVSVFGLNPARQFDALRERVGVLLQNVDEQIIAPTVWDDVSFSLRNYGYAEDEVARRGEAVLEAGGLRHPRPQSLPLPSGGGKRQAGHP